MFGECCVLCWVYLIITIFQGQKTATTCSPVISRVSQNRENLCGRNVQLWDRILFIWREAVSGKSCTKFHSTLTHLTARRGTLEIDSSELKVAVDIRPEIPCAGQQYQILSMKFSRSSHRGRITRLSRTSQNLDLDTLTLIRLESIQSLVL